MVDYKIVEAHPDCVVIKNINPEYLITKSEIQIENMNEIPIFLTTIELLKSNLSYEEIENFLLKN